MFISLTIHTRAGVLELETGELGFSPGLSQMITNNPLIILKFYCCFHNALESAVSQAKMNV